MTGRIPSISMDLYAPEQLLDPYDRYATLRNLGPLVYLENLHMYVAARYRDVREILSRPDVFTSGSGVMMNDVINNAFAGKVGLCSDGDAHRHVRSIESLPLKPRALGELRETIGDAARTVVDKVVESQRFDAATELAQHLPLTVVSKLVGLPESGRERMLEWAAASFDSFGPLNERTTEALSVSQEMQAYAMTQCVRGKLMPGGWADMLHDAADRGEIDEMEARMMALSYVGPSLDTTIFATSSAIWLFSQYPDQWDELKANPSVIPNAINEVIRLESPVQGFSRLAVADFDLDGVTVPAGARVIALFGSANRDERHWGDPETFNVRRSNAKDHLGFGLGKHQCIGSNLARMEISALLDALRDRVSRYELHHGERILSSTLRGFMKLDVSIH